MRQLPDDFSGLEARFSWEGRQVLFINNRKSVENFIESTQPSSDDGRCGVASFLIF